MELFYNTITGSLNFGGLAIRRMRNEIFNDLPHVANVAQLIIVTQNIADINWWKCCKLLFCFDFVLGAKGVFQKLSNVFGQFLII